MEHKLSKEIKVIFTVIAFFLIFLPFFSIEGNANVNTTSFVELKRLNTDGYSIGHVEWSPDGSKILASTNNNIIIKDYLSGNTEKIIVSYDDIRPPSPIAWSSNGTNIAFAYGTGTTVIKDYPTNANNVTFDLGGPMDLSPDNKKLLVGGIGTKNVYICDILSGIVEKELLGHIVNVSGIYDRGEKIHTVKWSPNGSRFATGSEDKNVSIWNYLTGEIEKTLVGHTDEVREVVWSPDGKNIASGSLDGTIRIWNSSTGDIEKVLNVEYFQVHSIDWSPDGKNIAVATSSHVELFEIASNKAIVLDIFPWPTGGSVHSVKWSPDGTKIAIGAANSDIIVWGNTADLTISSSDISFSTDIISGEEVMIYTEVHNVGIENSGEFMVEFYYQSSLIGSDIINVSAGNSTIASVSWIPPDIGGNDTIYIYLDTMWDVHEENEDNNSASLIVHIEKHLNYNILYIAITLIILLSFVIFRIKKHQKQ